MGCFLSCFHGGSDLSGGDLRDPLVRESRLGDVFLNDEKKFDEATGKLDVEAANGHGVDEELWIEANYLKSCGTIYQTPPEILDSIPTNSEDGNECVDTPTNVQLMKDVVLLEENSSEILDSQILDSIPTNSEDGNECVDTPTNVQLMKDVVLIEENSSELLNSNEHDVPGHEQEIDEGILREIVEHDVSRHQLEVDVSLEGKPLCQNVRDQSIDSSDSPYPTPLVLRGDIQTPGTYYTAYKETSKPGKRTRASRQFIYPVLRPIENKMQWMELKAESLVLASNPPKRRNLTADPSDNSATQNEMMSPEEPKGQNVNQLLDESELSSKQYSEFGKHGVTSLSHWLKPSSANDETGNSSDDGNFGKETCYETSASDVPIFPAFGLNWETDNPTPVLRKAWDGNGIPNTTTKYKEDQKVNWHATPFEERLLKVLSDEKPHHERKISGKLIHLEENA